jgi:aminopeptidase
VSTNERLADLIVRYSIAVRPGERVLILGPHLADSLMTAIAKAVRAAGAAPFLCYETAEPEQSHQELAQAGAAVFIESHFPRRTANQTILAWRRHQAHLAQLFAQRVAQRSLRWNVTLFPSRSGARRAGTTLANWRTTLRRACLLDSHDPAQAWGTFSEQMHRMADRLNRVREVRITTDAGTDFRLHVAGRTWVPCDGRWNLPDGEVFTGPHEDATEGTLFLPGKTSYGPQEIHDLWLRFREGRVIDVKARRNRTIVERLLSTDEGASRLGEVALGCNFALTQLTGHALIDEKVGGTCHVALGMAYPESGGTNQSQLHWDLVCDLRQGGRVEADGRIINKNGRFTDPGWPAAACAGQRA